MTDEKTPPFFIIVGIDNLKSPDSDGTIAFGVFDKYKRLFDETLTVAQHVEDVKKAHSLMFDVDQYKNMVAPFLDNIEKVCNKLRRPHYEYDPLYASFLEYFSFVSLRPKTKADLRVLVIVLYLQVVQAGSLGGRNTIPDMLRSGFLDIFSKNLIEASIDAYDYTK